MRGLRIGSLFGVEIRVDASWFIIMLLILYTLTTGVFPEYAPDRSMATYIGMGVVGAVLLFGSILAHELAHSLVSRARGIPVPAITLFVFGGISHTKHEPRRPGGEFLITIVGPLTSLALGAVFGGLWWVSRSAAGGPEPVSAVLRYLAVINVALGLFNLLPGFPLDGGRLLRSAVWGATGDRGRATRIAAGGGKLIGLLLMGLGLVALISNPVLNGLWLIFIGWFLLGAARVTERQEIQQAGAGTKAEAGAHPA